MRAADIKLGVNTIEVVDRANESAADNIDGMMGRRFYCVIENNKWDWPNFQFAYPWRLWFDRSEIADIANPAPVVNSGGVVISNNDILYGPWRDAPPYRNMELNRAHNAAFGNGPTPQQEISITALFGFWNRQAVAGTLALAISSTSITTATVSNGATPGVGDVLIVDSERMLVQDRSYVTSGQTQQGTGCSTAQNSDNALAVTDGTKFSPFETVVLDQERMFVYQIIGNVLTVKRGYDGTVLATHEAATVYSARQLTVTRGDFGTTAATHSQNVSVSSQLVPPLIRDLALAEASVQAAQELGLYSDTQGESGATTSGLGASLADKWEEAEVRYSRQIRTRVI
jgi:hypothetical protein